MHKVRKNWHMFIIIFTLIVFSHSYFFYNGREPSECSLSVGHTNTECFDFSLIGNTIFIFTGEWSHLLAFRK